MYGEMQVTKNSYSGILYPVNVIVRIAKVNSKAA